jgi:hypothetical protein
MQTFNSDFIADFKLGDNIVYNLKVLSVLYDAMNQAGASKKYLFYKPITLLNVSIFEALMHDFIFRMKHFTVEGVAGIAEATLMHFRIKKLDKLELFIKHFEKNGILNDKEFEIYKKLDELRKLRNRIHIQNDKHELERDDRKAFNKERMKNSEMCLESVVDTLSKKHSRAIGSHVNDFELPFASHFSS